MPSRPRPRFALHDRAAVLTLAGSPAAPITAVREVLVPGLAAERQP